MLAVQTIATTKNDLRGDHSRMVRECAFTWLLIIYFCAICVVSEPALGSTSSQSNVRNCSGAVAECIRFYT